MEQNIKGVSHTCQEDEGVKTQIEMLTCPMFNRSYKSCCVAFFAKLVHENGKLYAYGSQNIKSFTNFAKRVFHSSYISLFLTQNKQINYALPSYYHYYWLCAIKP